MESGQLQELVRFVDLERLPLALLGVALAWGLLTLATRLLDDLSERITERRLLFKQAKALTRFFVYLIVPVAVASSVLRLESEVLFAVAGSVSVAVGFAFKDLLGSLIAGVILLIDRPFQVGDRISFAGFYGEVLEMGLRSVRLATLDDNLVTLPNNQFLTDPVASANAGELHAMVVMPFYLAAAEDFHLARRLVAEATATSRYAYLNRPVVTLVEDRFVGERFVTVITVKAYVFDVRYEKQFITDVTERVKEAFRSANLRLPDQAYRDLALYGREAPPGPGGAQPGR
jgi:small-conductance mechanosensitive channel